MTASVVGDPRRILAVTYGGGHVAMVLPILKRLRELGHEIHVVGLTTAYDVLRNAGFEPIRFQDLLTNADAGAVEHGRRLLGDMHTPGKVDIEESIAYLGLSYADLENRLGADEAARQFANRGRQAFAPIGPMERAFDRVQPDVLLMTNAPRAESAALQVANRRGIPSVGIVDLFGIQEFEPRTASRICAPSARVASILADRGINRETIAVTGNPNFDRILKMLGQPDQHQAWRRSVGIPDDVQLILYAMQPDHIPGIFPSLIEDSLARCLARHANLWVVVRPHPSQTAAVAERVVERLGARAISGVAPSLDAVLQSCDTLVTSTSTVAIEAALLGKLVLIYGHEKMDAERKYPIEQFIQGHFADSPQSTERILTMARHDLQTVEQRGSAVREMWCCDGHAAERIAAVVERVR